MAYIDSTTNNGSSTTPSVPVPTGVQDKTIVILTCSFDAMAAVFEDADWPSGFAELYESKATAVDGQTTVVGWKRATGNDAGSYTFGSVHTQAQDWVCQAFAFSGRHETNPPVATEAINNDPNETPVTATATGVTAILGDDLLWVVSPDAKPVGAVIAITVPGDFTERENYVNHTNTWSSLAGATKENVSAGATGNISGSFTMDAGAQSGWTAYLVRIPSAPPPDVQFDAVSGGNRSTGISQNWLHTCSGNNRVLVVGVSYGESSTVPQVDTVTYTKGGATANLTRIDYQKFATNETAVELWGMIAPDTGEHTVTVTLKNAPSDQTFAGAISVNNADQISPFRTPAKTAGTGIDDITINVPSAVNDLVVDVSSTGGAFNHTVQTQRLLVNVSNANTCNNFAMSTAVGADSVVAMGYHYDTTDQYELLGVSIKPFGSAELSQSAYRFRNDDNNEANATWKANENTGLTAPTGANVRIRTQLDTEGDMPSVNRLYKYRKQGETDWRTLQ